MTWFKRISLFLLVNILVITTISILLNLLGVQPYLTSRGIDYQNLLVFCLVWGMGGAFISLGLSRIMAKMGMGVKVIDPNETNPALRQLVMTVHKLAQGAGLPAMPQVGVYQSPEVNAFATGPTKSRSLVAVSTGLLNRMDQKEIEGVLAHEVSHIANGDMVTMTLLQGIINAFVMFLARAIAFAISQGGRNNERSSGGESFFLVFILQIVLSFMGMLVVAAFSRWREYRADRGGATLAGRSSMISALEKLRSTVELVDNRQQSVSAFKISSGTSFLRFLSTHPPLEDRIARLRSYAS